MIQNKSPADIEFNRWGFLSSIYHSDQYCPWSVLLARISAYIFSHVLIISLCKLHFAFLSKSYCRVARNNYKWHVWEEKIKSLAKSERLYFSSSIEWQRFWNSLEFQLTVVEFLSIVRSIFWAKGYWTSSNVAFSNHSCLLILTTRCHLSSAVGG